jgi:hypothetical protein
MSCKVHFAVAVVLLGASGVTCAQSTFSASVSGFADDENGRSIDLNTMLAARDWLTLGAGLGATESRTASDSLEGTSLSASAHVHSERLGARGYYRSWKSNGVDSDTLGVRAHFTQNNLTLAILGESRGLDVDYIVEASNPQRATAHFSATGWGGGASYQWSHWNVYAEGMAYHYGSLSRYVPPPSAAPTTGFSGLPTLPITPALPEPTGAVDSVLPALGQALSGRVSSLAGSFVTLNQGVFDHVLSAGVERGFSRASLRLDWTAVKDAVLDTNINNFSTGYRYRLSSHLAAGVTLGVTQSRYGSVNFGGLSFGVTL